MSKIVQAINAMIENKDDISEVTLGASDSDEFFFIYKKKFFWSIAKTTEKDNIILWYYPTAKSLEFISQLEGPDWQGIPMVIYKAKEIGTREAQESFLELYSTVKEKLYNMNAVLDEIIHDLPF